MREQIEAFATELLDCSLGELSLQPVMGGDINDAYKAANSSGQSVFIKANTDENVLRSERNGLIELRKLAVKHYPQVLAFQALNGVALLALEFHQLERIRAATAANAAQALIEQHEVSHAQFGWHEDGHIGASPQKNGWHASWATFFIECRLQPQLELALVRGLGTQAAKTVESVMNNFESLVDCSSIRPALLHGDLWGGNLSFSNTSNAPLYYDPAPYFGDAEVDIAMTTLFGRFHDAFYGRYRTHFPASDCAEIKSCIYNIYHALNHFNLFGSGYESMVESLAKRSLLGNC